MQLGSTDTDASDTSSALEHHRKRPPRYSLNLRAFNTPKLGAVSVVWLQFLVRQSDSDVEVDPRGSFKCAIPQTHRNGSTLANLLRSTCDPGAICQLIMRHYTGVGFKNIVRANPSLHIGKHPQLVGPAPSNRYGEFDCYTPPAPAGTSTLTVHGRARASYGRPTLHSVSL